MKILALETSCDDTAVAIVDNGCRVISSVRVSQGEHNDWGGVVPEIAARLHAENWRGALEECLSIANISITEIEALAVTQGPGLQTSLLSGTTAASFLSQLYQKPLIPVHHVHGHLCSVFLERELDSVEFPALVLTVSGGHTDLYLWKSPTHWEKLGGTLDDAAGEAFDKTAKMLGLGYPGGPIVSERALLGDRQKYKLPVPNLGKDSLDFSFSGVKSAIYRLVQDYKSGLGVDEMALSPDFVNNVCASFETIVSKIFVKKITTAFAQNPNVKTLCFVGGVSANTYIKRDLETLSQQYGIKFLTPVKNEYSTDNAAMIASSAYFLRDTAKIQHVEASPRLNL